MIILRWDYSDWLDIIYILKMGKPAGKRFLLSAACHQAGMHDVFWSPNKFNVVCPSRSTFLCTATSIYNLSRWIHNTSQPRHILKFLPLLTHFSVTFIFLAAGQMGSSSHWPERETRQLHSSQHFRDVDENMYLFIYLIIQSPPPNNKHF